MTKYDGQVWHETIWMLWFEGYISCVLIVISYACNCVLSFIANNNYKCEDQVVRLKFNIQVDWSLMIYNYWRVMKAML